MNLYFRIYLISALFYGLIPYLSAHIISFRWYSFRERIRQYHYLPSLNYLAMNESSHHLYRFMGEIEAIEGRHKIWLQAENMTVVVDIRGCHAYAMPGQGGEKNGTKNSQMRKISPDEIFSFTEGTKIYVSGCANNRSGKIEFGAKKDQDLILVVYRGEDEEFERSAVDLGRSGNEYWNLITPWSFFTGMILILMTGDPLFGEGSTYGAQIAALSLGLLPVLMFMPPGIVLISFFRRLWQCSLSMAIQEDLSVWDKGRSVSFPMRSLKVRFYRFSALSLLGLDYIINAILFVYLFTWVG